MSRRRTTTRKLSVRMQKAAAAREDCRPGGPPVFMPSPREIKAACEAIRAEHNEPDEAVPWTAPEVPARFSLPDDGKED